MGTSLTGTKPKDTYDSLIKVGDNGPISGTAKVLSDGLGNDLPIAVSTSNVGIGTSAPTVKLDVESGIEGITAGFAGATYGVRIDNGGTFSTGASTIHGVNSTLTASYQPLRLNGSYTALCVSNTEVVRATANGLTFNGDTAAANALDDYEEGTWTMGIAFGGASVGIVYGVTTGTYTKIGRQVTVNGYLSWTSKGSSTGAARLTGLPFACANASQFYTIPAIRLTDVSFADALNSYVRVGETQVSLQEIVASTGTVSDLNDTNFQNNGDIMINLTYFV